MSWPTSARRNDSHQCRPLRVRLLLRVALRGLGDQLGPSEEQTQKIVIFYLNFIQCGWCCCWCSSHRVSLFRVMWGQMSWNWTWIAIIVPLHPLSDGVCSHYPGCLDLIGAICANWDQRTTDWIQIHPTFTCLKLIINSLDNNNKHIVRH